MRSKILIFFYFSNLKIIFFSFYLFFQRNISYLLSCNRVPLKPSLFFSFPHLSFPNFFHLNFSFLLIFIFDLYFSLPQAFYLTFFLGLLVVLLYRFILPDLLLIAKKIYTNNTLYLYHPSSSIFLTFPDKSYAFFLPLIFPLEDVFSPFSFLFELFFVFYPLLFFYSFSMLIFSFFEVLESSSFKPFLLEDDEFPFPEKFKENLEKGLEKIKETGSNLNIYLLTGCLVVILLGGCYLFTQIDPYVQELIEITRKIAYAHSKTLSLVKDIDTLSKNLNESSFSRVFKEHNSENDLLYSLLKNLENKLSEYNKFSSINQYYINLRLEMRSLNISFKKNTIILKNIHDYEIYYKNIKSYFSHDFETFYKRRNP